MRYGLMFPAMITLMPSWLIAQAPPAPVQMTSKGEFHYRLECPQVNYDDTITLFDGRKLLGKVMEWADQIILYRGADAPQCFPVETVREFHLRRQRRHLRRPDVADLTIACIERLPRDVGMQGRLKLQDGVYVLEGAAPPASALPAAGAKVTFRVHVLNGGAVKSGAAECILTVGGAQISKTPVAALAPGESKVIEASWNWKADQTVRAEIKPVEQFEEIAVWNNTREEPCDAVGVTVLVNSELYEKIRSIRNLVDTFTIEDWIRYHLQVFNGLLAASVYPTSPQGVLERVRCDRIIVFEGGVEDYLVDAERKGESPGAVRLLLDQPPPGVRGLVDAATQVDWRMLQDLGRQLGLVDWSAADTRLEQCMVRKSESGYWQLQHLFPYRNTLMCSPGGFRLSEVDAAWLNASRGRPRGIRGELLYQLPSKINLRILGNTGAPLSGVDVDGFQLMSSGEAAGTIAGAGGNDPLFTITTDENGLAALPAQEVEPTKTAGGQELKSNPFGRIAADGSNGLLLLRVRQGGYDEFHFLRLFDCLLAQVRGSKDEYVHTIETRISEAGAPNGPPYTNGLPRPNGGFYCGWLMPAGTSGRNLQEFRIYKRIGLTGQDTRPWTLEYICRPVDGKWTFEADIDCFRNAPANGPHTRDTFSASAFVDASGRESTPSAVPAYFSHGRDVVAMAVAPDLTPEHRAFLTTTGIGEQQMLGWTSSAGTQPLGFRHRKFPAYSPAYAGIAFGQDGRVIVTDPVNHVLVIYDDGDMAATIPARGQWPGTPSGANGEFNEPIDVAVDDQGRIYVADRANNRVQILDADGNYESTLDPELTDKDEPVEPVKANAPAAAPVVANAGVIKPFSAPDGLGYSNGHLCVTDLDGTRVRVYDVKGAQPVFVYQATKLLNADRGLVNRDGDLFVLGQSPTTKEWGMLIFDRNGEKALYRGVRTVVEGEISNVDRPRGFSYFTTMGIEYGYFINAAPFNLRRTFLMKELPKPGENPPGQNPPDQVPAGQNPPGANQPPPNDPQPTTPPA